MKTGIVVAVFCMQAILSAAQESKQAKEIVTPSGLRYTILKKGVGDDAKAGDEILIHEKMSYRNGMILYVSKEMGNLNPVKARLGAKQIIDGLDEGIRGMQTGEVRKLIVPPSLSLRTEYPPGLPRDSTLVYEIELVKILTPGK